MWKSCDDDCKRGYLLNTESGLCVAGTAHTDWYRMTLCGTWGEPSPSSTTACCKIEAHWIWVPLGTVIIFVVSIGLLTTLVEYKTYVFVSIIKIKTQWAVEPRDATK
jgi:hypothetical protein